MGADSTSERISDRLDAIEEKHGVKVLYACESGSRAWGFPSADSDYDVRVVYVHPRDWYLSLDLERRDDTIDPPVAGDLDLHGWDLRKALQLFHAANPTLLEWLRSPIVYREDEAVMDRWRALISDYYVPGAVGPAYRGMARSITEQNLDDPPIPHKAYLYVLRALLAVRWIEQDRGPVPVEFARLVDAAEIDPELRTAIDTLLDRKRTGAEMETGPHLPVVHDFIEAEIERQTTVQFPDSETHPDIDPLNTFFRHVLDRPASRP
jgi:predicted nucleotidyltransferase